MKSVGPRIHVPKYGGPPGSKGQVTAAAKLDPKQAAALAQSQKTAAEAEQKKQEEAAQADTLTNTATDISQEEQLQQNIPQQRQQDRLQKQQRGTEQKSSYHKSSADQAATQVPKQFGHKANFNPEVAKKIVQQIAQDFEPPAFMTREQFHEILEQSPRLAKQILEKPSHEMRQRFIRDGVLKHHPQGARLQQKLAEQAQRQQQQAEQGRGAREIAEDILKKGDIVQIFRLRHQSEDKDAFRNILRHEMAKAKARALQEKVQGIKQQAEGQGGEGKARGVNRPVAGTDIVKQALAQKLANSSAASSFESILQQVLAGSKAVPNLPDGVKAKFLLKSDAQWQQFFQNVLGLKSAEVKSQAQFEKLTYALYRGMFQRAQEGKKAAVVDLIFSENEEHKFSQILLDDEMAELLKTLSPGDEISKEVLKKLGEELLYLKLAHVVNQAQLTEDQKQNILKEFQRQFSSASRDKLETALIASRQQKQPEPESPPFVYAGNQFDRKEEKQGQPKFSMLVFYTALAGLLAIALFLAFKFLL